MDWNASVGFILLGAFWLGALHALEPGHGKSIMGAYLVASRGGVRHAVLLGIVVTITHTIIVFILAFAALRFAASVASELYRGWLIGDLCRLEAGEIERALDGLPDDRKHAADVTAGALRAAACHYQARRT